MTAAPPATNVLAPSDFTYKGLFRTPYYGGLQVLSASYGQLTGRVRSGTTTLIMQGGVPAATGGGCVDLIELSIPDESDLTNDPSTAPYSSQIRTWGTGGGFYLSSPYVMPDSGNSTPSGPHYPVFAGMSYVGNQFGNGTQLIWSYATDYGNLGEMPNVFCTVLNDDGSYTHYGPWAAGQWAQLTGTMIPVPASVQAATGCGPIGVVPLPAGSQLQSNMGASLWTFTPPALATAADVLGGSNAIADLRAAIYYNAYHPQARNTHAKLSSSVVANQAYPCPGGRSLADIDPIFGGKIGASGYVEANLDWVSTGVWIDGPTKQGVLFFGQLAETISIANGFSYDKDYGGDDPTNCHFGYGGANPECYGQAVIQKATGPFASSLGSHGWIFDPADLVAILNGAATYSKPAVHDFSVKALGVGFLDEFSTYPQLQGAWFEPTSKRLYVSENFRDHRGCCDNLPVIHVLAVDC